jgi:hypothetical protein
MEIIKMSNVLDLMKKEYEGRASKVVWSDTLQTRAGSRIAMLNMDSYMEHEGYSYVAFIDYGNEIAVETYNDNGEWNCGDADHPMNIVEKKAG